MKDCTIVFMNGQTYDFEFSKLQKALEFCTTHPTQYIKTPYGCLQIFSEEDLIEARSIFDEA